MCLLHVLAQATLRSGKNVTHAPLGSIDLGKCGGQHKTKQEGKACFHIRGRLGETPKLAKMLPGIKKPRLGRGFKILFRKTIC